MNWKALATVFLVTSKSAVAQDVVITSPIDGSQVFLEQPDVAANSVHIARATGATVRGLDKVSGEVVDMELAVGQSKDLGRIDIKLGECRYPEDNLAGEAFAWIEVSDSLRSVTVFEGWMIASRPALNALDHARYDVWIIRCTNA